ncbi:outer membrane protein assembly factor BamA [Candidatus Pseudothioglobus singularis]|nr:outer membrane protein assembly factor BamA [Candidatus Pseudothioglobus singularis]
MKNIAVKFLILFLLFFTNQTGASPINKINFIGLNANSENNLLDILTFKSGQELSTDGTNNIIRELYDTGYFSDISITQNNAEINITVSENPYVKYLIIDYIPTPFWSNWLNVEPALLSQDNFDEISKINELSSGEVYTKAKLSSLISSIESQFIQAGFYNISIKQSLEIDTQNRAGISLLIDQGKSANVEAIKILGSTKFSEKELLNLFPIGESSIFFVNYFTKRDDYTEDQLSLGLKKLTDHYLNSGFLDFQVTNVTTKLDETNTKISLEIEISEGIQYKLGEVAFSGELGGISENDLFKLLSLNTGEIFNRQSVVNDIQTITDLYADQGFAFVDIRPITNDFLDTVNIDISISLNKKVYINRISISGNTRTLDEVIRREIGISEGGLYSRSLLRNSVVKLRRLGYFSDVKMNASEIEGSQDRLNIEIEVTETKTGSLSFSVSHSNNYGVSVGAGIREKNIFGSGNTLNAQAKLSESFNKLSFYFENPNFNNEQHSINYGFFLSELDDNDVMKDSYTISSKGINFGYGIPLTEITKINTKLEYTNNEIKCGSSFSAVNYENTQCAKTNNDEIKLSLNWNENTLNDYLYPTKGRNNAIGLDLALPIADYRYYSINASHKSYTPVADDLTLKITGSIGLIDGYSDNEVPFFKRYFGGGSGSLRGFGDKTLGPLYPNNSSKGGELTVLGSANLITPAYLFDNSENMRLSAFIDTGNIYEKSSDIKLEDLRMSAGVGFAYLSPIGAIGMFISTPILKKSGDIIENFGFSLGTGF